MTTSANVTDALYDPRNGDLSLRVVDFSIATATLLQRSNYFSIVYLETGSGSVAVDDALHTYHGPCLFFFVPYQQVRFASQVGSSASAVQFHANFLCIETHHHEVGCNGVLFNDPFGVPLLNLERQDQQEFADLFGRIRRELLHGGLAQAELLVSYLKVLLVTATRLKLKQGGTAGPGAGRRPELLDALSQLIEANYRTKHAPQDYADLLHTTPKTLGRIVREHLGKTLTDLIRERILKHARWQLLHTLRPVKEIARELGYDDELYFSRLFKKATGLSPTHYREFETAIRGGSNLSMSSADRSIPASAVRVQNAGDSTP